MSWEDVLKEEITKDYFLSLATKVKEDRKILKVYPPVDKLFRALELTSFEEIKVVILGQDPYHQEGQANGLAFSVDTQEFPPSLVNIIKEVESDTECSEVNLESWAKQGVLLLNSILTVIDSRPGSHANIGWEKFTDKIIQEISTKSDHIVFILWGKFAQSKQHLIDLNKHAILKSVHPSPLSAHRGFFGSKPFTKTNELLKQWGKSEIIWGQRK